MREAITITYYLQYPLYTLEAPGLSGFVETTRIELLQLLKNYNKARHPLARTSLFVSEPLARLQNIQGVRYDVVSSVRKPDNRVSISIRSTASMP